MGNRSRHKSAKNRAAASAVIGPDSRAGDTLAVDPWNRLLRPSCSQFGGAIQWLTGEEATAQSIDLAPALSILGVSAVDGRDVWVCTRCGEHGVMGAAHGTL